MSVDIINKDFMDKRQANFVPLTPLSFLQRAAKVHAERVAITYGNRQYTWAETYQRCVRVASAIQKIGIKQGEVVTIMAHNTPEMFEAQFSIGMSGAVLNTLNVRLDSDTIAGILEHADTRLLLVDKGLAEVMQEALQKSENKNIKIIDIIDEQADESKNGLSLGETDYESFLQTGECDFDWQLPEDEWQSLALNYTSGTGGKPKGVVCHHRGAYLMAMGTIPAWGVPLYPTYLYTVPMFHCNGWGHAWMLPMVGGHAICTRKFTAESIFADVKKYKISHFGGAPTVLGMMANAPKEVQFSPDWDIKLMTAGAPPPPTVLEKVEALGFNVMQVYGLTETYGHVVHCSWKELWNDKDFSERATLKARQGVNLPHTQEVEIFDQGSGKPVPADGETMGELAIRSNTIMKGYHKNQQATEEVFASGYFRTGDLAVRHADNHVEVKDRLKDIIISGGENISSVELETVLYAYEGVAFAAVVAEPNEKWGESPCAFIEMQEGKTATEEELAAYCKGRLAGFKVPKRFIFQEIPKTSTGKLQKYLLRKQILED